MYTHTLLLPCQNTRPAHRSQQELEATYAELSDEVLKTLRRKLGLSKQRLEWNSALHRLSRMINK